MVVNEEAVKWMDLNDPLDRFQYIRIKKIIDAQNYAMEHKLGIWSIEFNDTESSSFFNFFKVTTQGREDIQL